MGSTPPPCPPSSHPTIPSFLYGFHLCLLLPSSPQEAPEALYIPDKTFSEGEKRRWWRGVEWVVMVEKERGFRVTTMARS